MSGFTLYSLRDALTAGDLTKARAAELLKKLLTLLTARRSQYGSKVRALQERSKRDILTSQLSVTRKLAFEAEMRPSVKAFQMSPAENRTSQSLLKQPTTAKPHRAQDATSETTRMTANTIWDNVKKFFPDAPKLERCAAYLNPVRPPDSAMTIQLGPHYSVAMNQELKRKFKNGNVQLRLPQALIQAPEQADVSPTVVFHRLLSALVPCDIDDYKVRNPQKHVVSSVPGFNQNQHPVDYPGTSPYSFLPFEQRLASEVKALGLIPDSSGPRLTDNEVMNEIMEKTRELTELMEKTNGLRKQIMDELKSKESELIMRAERVKAWEKAPVKSEQKKKNQKERERAPKSRDKL